MTSKKEPTSFWLSLTQKEKMRALVKNDWRFDSVSKIMRIAIDAFFATLEPLTSEQQVLTIQAEISNGENKHAEEKSA